MTLPKRKIDEALETIQKMTRQGYKCIISKKKLSNYKYYFYTGTTRKKCRYFKNTLFIDCLGNVKLCCFTEAIGNIRDDSLKAIYSSEKAGRIKKALEHCNFKNCNLPLCQDYSQGMILNLKKFFHFRVKSFFLYKLKFFVVYIIKTPDRLIGRFGTCLRTRHPDLYYKLKGTKGGK